MFALVAENGTRKLAMKAGGYMEATTAFFKTFVPNGHRIRKNHD